jgi:deazaflavin-dependent oxidoreductase (nitroreductase family)
MKCFEAGWLTHTVPSWLVRESPLCHEKNEQGCNSIADEREEKRVANADGEALVIIAGAAGSPKHPAWWLNLKANPETQVQIGRSMLQVRATEATPQEEQGILSRNPKQRTLYDMMQRTVARKIPVVILRPIIEVG